MLILSQIQVVHANNMREFLGDFYERSHKFVDNLQPFCELFVGHLMNICWMFIIDCYFLLVVSLAVQRLKNVGRLHM